jgi:hypothetical protein
MAPAFPFSRRLPAPFQPAVNPAPAFAVVCEPCRHPTQAVKQPRLAASAANSGSLAAPLTQRGARSHRYSQAKLPKCDLQ